MRAFLVCAVLLTGCMGPKWDTPEDAYLSFTKAFQKNNRKVAYGALSTETRHMLEEKSQAVAKASGGSVGDDPQGLFFARGAPPAQVTEVSLLKQEGDIATLRVAVGEQITSITMRREADGWKVDLTEALK